MSTATASSNAREDGAASAATEPQPPLRVRVEGAAPLGPPWSFAALLGPISVQDFCARYWGRSPLLIERACSDFYRGLISVAELERYLSVEELFARQDVRLRPADPGPPQPVRNLSTVYERLSRGKTLQLRRMECFMDPGAPLVALFRDMELCIQHPRSSLSCYLSPPGGEGLGAHHDETEIFTLQIAGRKRWRLYHQVATDRPRLYAREELGAPRHDVEVGPGDLLYHPRGHVHEVTAGPEPSFSITIVFEPVDWRALLELLSRRLSGTASFLQPLPAGVLLGGGGLSEMRALLAERAEDIRAELSRLSVEELVDALAARHVARMTLPPGKQLRTLFDVARVGPATRVAMRRDVRCHLERRDSRVLLTLPGGLVLPADERIEPALRYVLCAPGFFRVDEIEGPLGEGERLELVRELVRNGVLEVEEPS